MTITTGLKQASEALHRLEDPHRHFVERSRADRLLALTQLLAFVRGARPDATQPPVKSAPTRITIAGDA